MIILWGILCAASKNPVSKNILAQLKNPVDYKSSLFFVLFFIVFFVIVGERDFFVVLDTRYYLGL